MAEKLLKEHLYGDLLAPTPGYFTDFALGMTYCLSFEAMLTAHLAFGMLGEMDDNVIQSPHLLLEAITKSSEKTQTAEEMFAGLGMKDKERLLHYRRSSRVNIYELDGIKDYFYGYMAPSTGVLRYYDVVSYEDGFVTFEAGTAGEVVIDF